MGHPAQSLSVAFSSNQQFLPLSEMSVVAHLQDSLEDLLRLLNLLFAVSFNKSVFNLLILIFSILDGKEGASSPSLESTSSELSTSTSGNNLQK